MARGRMPAGLDSDRISDNPPSKGGGVTLAALVTVVLAAVTAISVIAYRHPKGYAKIYRVICEALLWAFFAIAGFGVGVAGAHKMLIPYIQPGKRAVAANEIASVTPYQSGRF